MQSKAQSVAQYLRELPAERRAQMERVREVILKNLPSGFEEVMNWGMITYQVPLKDFPDTYNDQPLMYAALASQKNHMAVYLMGIYASEKQSREFEAAYRATGKRYDVGKSCVRFRKMDDLPLELIGTSIGAFSMREYIEIAGRPRRAAARGSKKKKTTQTKVAKTVKKTALKKPAAKKSVLKKTTAKKKTRKKSK